MTLYQLYGPQSPDFVQGLIAALEYFGTNKGRLSLRLYGRPIDRAVLELEKQAILTEFTQEEEEIKI